MRAHRPRRRPGTWVALLTGMNSPHVFEDDPGLEGPDYVALVIEWADDDDITTVSAKAQDDSAARKLSIPSILGALGALGALILATWGLRRLRAVS
jgi:hypothetical protein